MFTHDKAHMKVVENYDAVLSLQWSRTFKPFNEIMILLINCEIFLYTKCINTQKSHLSDKLSSTFIELSSTFILAI